MTDAMPRHDALEDVAACFILRREDPSWGADDQRELEMWLEQSPRHKVVFWRLEKGWSEVDRVAALDIAPVSPEVNAAERWASRLGAVRHRLGFAIAASILPLMFAGFLFIADRPEPQWDQFATQIGQRKLVALPDGTQIDLNTDSRIRISMTSNARVVYLDRGEAYFDVSHDKRRPFIVTVGDRRITVLGTQFAVRRQADRIVTGVVQGRVQVGRLLGKNMRDVLILQRGDMAVSDKNQTLALYNDPHQVENLIGWQRGLIVLDRSTLGEAAQQFNRYNQRKLVVRDNETAAIPIGGAFRSTNVDGFARILSQVYGLQVQASDDQFTISKK